MIPFEVVVSTPRSGRTPADRARESLWSLGGRHPLALTFFVDATTAAEFESQREGLLALVAKEFDGDPPPVSVVAQAPAGGGHVALEATVLDSPAADVSVTRRLCGGLPYTVVTGDGVRQIHASGIASDRALDDTASQAKDVFARMEAILHQEGMTFQHVVRQWNYIERVLEVRSNGNGSVQAYQAFNDVRTLAYGPAEFHAGYPAATGIGQAAGGVLVEFIAIEAPPDVRVVPLSNPKQTDAHDYSRRQLVGESIDDLPAKSTPKFERAKLVARGDEEVLFLSGTAAIVGERSVAPGDVAAQTATTIDNITALVGDRRLTRLRAYVKRTGEAGIVRNLCEAAFGKIPALYVRADVCREELLVELEGVFVKSRGGADR